jgi:hypothetical protein
MFQKNVLSGNIEGICERSKVFLSFTFAGPRLAKTIHLIKKQYLASGKHNNT